MVVWGPRGGQSLTGRCLLSTVEAPPSSSDEDEDIQLEPEDYKQVSANYSSSLTNVSLVQSLAKGCCCSAEWDSAPDQVLS